jgi:hypothetical protein
MFRTVLAVTLYRCWRPGTFPVLLHGPAGPLRSSSSPPVRRVDGVRAAASDGESTGGRRASAAQRVSVGVVRGRPLRGSKSRSSSSRPPTIGLARVLLLRLRDGRPPGRRFSVSVTHSYWYVSECERAERPIASSSSCDKPINTLGGGSLGSCVDEERSQLR